MTVLGEALRGLPDGTFADVHESDDAYRVVLDLPGITEDALDVESGRGVLELTGTRASTVPEGYEPVRTERATDLEIALPLPPDARSEDVTWTIERGVLTLTVPKTDRSGPGNGSESETTE